MQRRLGQSDIYVSALGAGCWAISGPFWLDKVPLGWGEINDIEASKAIETACSMGINFFDTGDTYGAGHGERLLGSALSHKRDSVIIATKFGNVFDEDTKQVLGTSASPEYIKSACEASLQRLNTDYIDLYQFHLNDYNPDQAIKVRETLEELVKEGKIRYYGWSTDYTDRAEVFAQGQHCIAIQHEINVLRDNKEMIEFVEQHNLASINRGPLAMGLLSSKYDVSNNTEIQKNDVRANTTLDWLKYFKDGVPTPQFIEMRNSLREILTSNGRSLVQGALAWLWARSEYTIPIPGFRNSEQISESIQAMEKGPLTQEQMYEIEHILERN